MSTTNPAPKRRRTAVTYKPGKFDCANCRRDVRGETHVRHRDKDQYVLCTDCYSVHASGVSGAVWDADTVQLIDTSTTRMPLLVDDWSADHEVRLLEGILQFGFGNWRAVAEHLGFEKTEQECEEHYERFYVRSKTFPLPDLAAGPTTAAPPAAALASAAERGVSPVGEAARGVSPIGDVAMADAPALADPAADVPAAEATTTTDGADGATAAGAGAGAGAGGAAAGGAGGSVHGGGGGGGGSHRPNKPKQERRGASGMVIEGNTTPAADLVGYMPLRGEYDTEWSNEAELTICDIEFPDNETEDEKEAKLAALREYNRALDERQRRRDFVQQHDLIERAARQHTLDRKRTAEERTFRTAMRPYAPHTASDAEHEALVSDVLRESMLRMRASHLQACHAAGITSSAEADSLWKRRVSADALSTALSQAGAPRPVAPVAPARPAATVAAAPPPTAAAKPTPGSMQSPAAAAAAARAAATANGKAKELLSSAEARACFVIGLLASQYVAGKRMLLSENARRGGLSLAVARDVLKPKLDARRAKLLWQHCVRAGWVAAKE